MTTHITSQNNLYMATKQYETCKMQKFKHSNIYVVPGPYRNLFLRCVPPSYCTHFPLLPNTVQWTVVMAVVPVSVYK